MASVRGGESEVVVLEDPAINERRMPEMEDAGSCAASSTACEALAGVRLEIDKLAGQVSALETIINSGTKVADKDLAVLVEVLMMQLLRLDAIEAEGDTKMQRKHEVRRIQGIVDTVDALKAKNANPFIGASVSAAAAAASSAPVTTAKWVAFDSGFGTSCLSAPMSTAPPLTTTITHDWETFD